MSLGAYFASAGIGFHCIQKCLADRGPDDPRLLSIKELHRRFKSEKDALDERRDNFVGHAGIGVGFENHPGNASNKCGHEHRRAGIPAHAEYEISSL